MPLYRSLLFAPGNVPRRIEKAFGLDADVVIVDLEDSVALSDKEATRKPVAEALARARKGRGYVRVNAPSSPFCYGDLVATIHQSVDGVLLPKVESAADLHAIDWLLAALERERGIAEGAIDLIPQVETAGNARFAAAFSAKWSAPPSFAAAQGYAAASVLAEAVRRTGSLDQAKLRDTLATMESETVLGGYRVDPQSGEQRSARPAVVQIQRGRPQVVWPPALQNATLEPYPQWEERRRLE